MIGQYRAILWRQVSSQPADDGPPPVCRSVRGSLILCRRQAQSMEATNDQALVCANECVPWSRLGRYQCSSDAASAAAFAAV